MHLWGVDVCTVLRARVAGRVAVAVASRPDSARQENPRQDGVSVTRNSEGSTHLAGSEASESFPVSLLTERAGRAPREGSRDGTLTVMRRL